MRPDYQPPQLSAKVLLHGHCHHKALMKMSDEESLLRKMGADLQSIDSGCCGMAGPFGFEKDKYEVSQAVGERVLLPAVRKHAGGRAHRFRRLQLPGANLSSHGTPGDSPGRSLATGYEESSTATLGCVGFAIIIGRVACASDSKPHSQEWLCYLIFGGEITREAKMRKEKIL